jgi:hypothetical protein
LQVADIEKQRARSVGVIRDMRFAAGKVPHQPRINCSEGQFALVGTVAGTFHIVEYPLHLGAREIGIDHKACALGDVLLQALFLQFIADGGRSAVLPNNGVVDGLARGTVPHHGRFALIGDADGGNVLGAHLVLVQHLAGHFQLAVPYLHRVVFHPSRLWKILVEFLLCRGNGVAVLVKKDCA